MDITLQQESLSFYAPVYTACTSQENTAESVVPDRMPDVHRLLDTDAAVYLRRKTPGTKGYTYGHVGIYVGDGMMIPCGNPIQYASINSSYWQAHFYCFGRLP